MVVLKPTLCARGLILLRNFLLPSARGLSSKIDPKGVAVDDFEDAEEIEAREAEIEKKRNKSRLRPEDYKTQHGIPSFTVTEKTRLIDKRRAYGKLGKASEIDPALLWPTKEELAFVKEYESVLQPHSIQQLIEMNQVKKKLKEEERIKIQKEVLNKIANIDKEIVEFHKRYAAKKEKTEAAILKKQKLVEQVRKHFNYMLEPKDQKFKAMLAEMQEKERKQKKAEKKIAKKEFENSKFDSQGIESEEKTYSKEE